MRRLSFQGMSCQHLLSETADAMPAYEIEIVEAKDGGRESILIDFNGAVFGK